MGQGHEGDTMLNFLRFAGLFAVASALAGCHGSSSSSSSTNIAGPWSGFYSLSTSSSFTNATMGALNSDGDGYFADNQGDVYVFSDLSGPSPFTASLTAIAPTGQTFSNGKEVINFSVDGTYLPSAAGINMKANFNENDNQGSLSGSFNLTTDNPYSGTSTLANLEGQWSGYYIGKAGTSITLDFGSTGGLAGNDGYGCVLTGALVQDVPNSNIDLYDVSFQSSGQNCPGSLSGLAYESSSDVTGVFGGASGTYLYMAVYSTVSAYVIELKL